jgi:hypothetical protein
MSSGIIGSAVTMLMNVVTRKYIIPYAKTWMPKPPRKEILKLIKWTESGEIRWTKQKVVSVIFYAKVSWEEYRVQNNDVGFMFRSDNFILNVYKNEAHEKGDLTFIEHKHLLKKILNSPYTVELEQRVEPS